MSIAHDISWRSALLLGVIAAACASASAPAQTGGYDPAGDWRVEADGCAGNGSLTPLSGRMTIEAAGEGYVARFFIRQGEATAIQTAEVTVEGDRVRIDSEVIRAWAEGGYFPDDFDVAFVNANRMEGNLLSIVTCDAVLERVEPLPGMV